jgi:hemerythrin-like domain-containing protein
MSFSRFDQYLTQDHRACDALLGELRTAAKAGDWAAADSAFARFQHDVLAHFAAEEAVLFPAFETRTGMTGGPTRVMRMEHDEARLLIEDLAEAVAQANADGIRGHGEALLILLQQHNMKEENILYPTAADVAGKDLPALSAEVIAHREAA